MTKKQWRFEKLTQQLHTLSVMMAADTAHYSAAHQTAAAAEQALFADETRNLHIKTSAVLERYLLGDITEDQFNATVSDVILQIRLLALNAAIIASKTDFLCPLAVYADEIRNISVELIELEGKEPASNQAAVYITDSPTAEPRSAVLTEPVHFFTAVSGKYQWTENLRFVMEVLLYCPEYINDGKLQIVSRWRHMEEPLPVVFPDAAYQQGTFLAIVCDAENPRVKYAVAIDMPDDIGNMIYRSYPGLAIPSALPIPVRECWRGANGTDMCFLAWNKYITE